MIPICSIPICLLAITTFFLTLAFTVFIILVISFCPHGSWVSEFYGLKYE